MSSTLAELQKEYTLLSEHDGARLRALVDQLCLKLRADAGLPLYSPADRLLDQLNEYLDELGVKR